VNLKFTGVCDDNEKYILEYIHTKELSKITPSSLRRLNASRFHDIGKNEQYLNNLAQKGYLTPQKQGRGTFFKVNE